MIYMRISSLNCVRSLINRCRPRTTSGIPFGGVVITKNEEIPERAIPPDQLCNKDIPSNGWNADAACRFHFQISLVPSCGTYSSYSPEG